MSRVLIIARPSQDRQLLQAEFEARGFGVVVSSSGRQAVELGRASPPQAVVADLSTLVTDGCDLCRHWRAEPSLEHVPVVLYYARASGALHRELILGPGADRFVIEPQDPGVLVRAVQEALHEKRLKMSLVPPAAFHGTDHERAEAEARKLLQADVPSPVAVMITNLGGMIEYVNPAFSRMTGYTAAEACGQTPRLLKSGVHPAELYAELWNTVLSGGEWHGQLCNKKKNGDLCWESTTISPIRDETGQITHLVAVQEDATNRKRLSDELTQAKEAAEAANHAKSAFLAHMSHEIRTPMNAILGFSQLMLRDANLSPQQREHVVAINRSGEHLLGLMSNILEMSRIEAGRTSLVPGPCDLLALLGDLELMFRARADAKRLGLWLEHSGSGPTEVVGDANKLRQILINLVGNAIKFTEEGGVGLRLGVRMVSSGGARLVAEVKDTGCGIAPQDVIRLFGSFEQAECGRSAGGTGLGLAISSEFARLMGGEIAVTSEPGKGSIFRLEVPVTLPTDKRRAEPVIERPGHDLRPDHGERRILIVDDQKENRVSLSRLLSSMGFLTQEADDGQAALAALDHWQPTVVLMDLHMPTMDGYEAIRHIRGRGLKVPIIAISASAFEDNHKEAMDVGANDFITKPFRAADLLDRLNALAAAERSRRQERSCSPESLPDVRDSASSLDVSESLARVPPELIEQMWHATASARQESLLQLIDRLATDDAGIAEALRGLADRFKYDVLLEALDKHRRA